MKNLFLILISLYSINSAFCQNELGTKVALQDRSMELEFNTINVSGLAVVYFKQGKRSELKMKLSGINKEDVVIKNENNVLYVSTKGEHNGEEIKIFVTNPTLKKVEVSDNAEFYTRKKITVNELIINANGVSSTHISLNSEDLKVNMNGGDVRVEGKATKFAVNNNDEENTGTLVDKDLTVSEK